MNKRLPYLFLMIFGMLALSLNLARATGTPISLYKTYSGNYDYKIIGNTESSNELCPSEIQPTSSNLNLPAGASVAAAYLYWSGSGAADNKVTLNGQTVNASRTFSIPLIDNYYNMTFFGAFANVTSLVNSSGNYSVNNLSWTKSGQYCQGYSAYGGWALLVVYQASSLPSSNINIYDGFKGYWPAGTLSHTLTNLNIPASCSPEVELTHITWEGDSYKGEHFYINNNYIGDNTLNGSTSPNLDIDYYNISNYVSAGDNSIALKTTSYLTNNAIEWYINNVYVVKSTSCAPCAGQGGDSDGDGICNNQDNCPDTYNPNQADSDGDGIGDVCDTPGADCNNINITTGNGSITVSGLNGAPVSSLQIFNANWQQQYSCFADCGASQTVNLAAGTYLIYAKYYSSAYALICQREETVTVTGGGNPCDNNGGDADGDGVCGNQDNCPNTYNPDQADSDGDGIGDVCDTPGADCSSINITGGNGAITVSGLDGAPVSSLQVFNANWQQEFNCFANCGATETINLAAGTYLVYAKYYTSAYVLICQREETVTVTGGGNPCDNNGGDADGDGICDNQDNCPGTYNPNQTDSDGDGIGDACDTGGGVLPAGLHPKFVNELPQIPRINATNGGTYQLGMEQSQQWLGLVDGNNNAVNTPVWGYTFNGNQMYLGPTFLTKKDRPVDVRWINNLPYNHLLPVDETIHKARPSAGIPTVVHLHGGHVETESDGGPDSWFTQNFAEKGYEWAKETYHYTNDQEAASLWYHDHTLGMTRLNVYAGLAGMYLLRDDNELSMNLPTGTYERELVIQDKQFSEDGSLYFPALLSDPEAQDFPTDPNIEPTIFPEFFGDYILVNGRAWPKMEVEATKYRFRLLNASDSRFYIFQLSNGAAFQQIGTDGGFLNNPVNINQLVLAPGERADVVIDFSTMQGQSVTLLNVGPDEPFKGLAANQAAADPNSTGCIMRFEVANYATSYFSIPNTLRQPIQYYGPEENTRQLLLLEGMDQFGRLKPGLGTAQDGKLGYLAPITENPNINTTEIWEVYNMTEDAHPIHIHQISFELVNRQEFTGDLDPNTSALSNIQMVGNPIPPAANEQGWKDTYIVPPGHVARFKVRFDLPGKFVWHCHILSHEDWDMMRPFEVIDTPTTDCGNINIAAGNGSITVSGLDGAPVSSLQIFNANWQQEYSCFANCGASQTVNLPNGTYQVYAKYYDNAYQPICQVEETITIGGGNPCDNVTNGGQIAGNESKQGAYDPAIITNVVTPTGGSGALEYIWLSSTSGCPTNINQSIPGATGATYDPGFISTTTYFVRCSRRAGCTDPGTWVESNCITKTVTAGDPCANNGGDSDGDGICDNQDNCPNTYNPGQTDSDGDGIGDDCDTPDNACSNISISTGNGSITVSGLDGAAVSSLQIFTATWQQQFNCFGNCGATETINLPNGTYLVFAKYYTSAYLPICQVEETVTVTGSDPCANNGGDSDGDGVCNNQDNCPYTYNPNQADSDGDGIGNVCDQNFDCTPVTLAKWDLEACYSNSGNNSGSDYSEFTASYPNGGNCINVSATTIHRDQGNHSCTPGYNGNTGMCVGTDAGCSFIDNDPYALRFEVTLNPGDAGKLSGFTFYEKAPTHYNWIGGASGLNDYPKKYGIRVLKNGQEVFKQTGISTTQSWSLESFDFSNDPDFEITTTTTFSFELRAYCRAGIWASQSVWDVDDFKITGCCSGIAPRQIDLFAFDATKAPQSVDLAWTITTDYKTDRYLIERSADGINFEVIEESDSKYHSVQAVVYETKDKQPAMGANYYRVKQLFDDGSFRYSETRQIIFEADPDKLVIFPNPTSDRIHVGLKEYAGMPAVIQIHNSLGVLLQERTVEALTVDPIAFEVGEYNSGVYTVTLRVDGRKQLTKLFVISKL